MDGLRTCSVGAGHGIESRAIRLERLGEGIYCFDHTYVMYAKLTKANIISSKR
jgi:hypothetical protein